MSGGLRRGATLSRAALRASIRIAAQRISRIEREQALEPKLYAVCCRAHAVTPRLQTSENTSARQGVEMVKKLKAMAEKSHSESQLRAAVKDSAQEIWLAGLGAFAKAQEEGQKVFKALVREGTSIQKRTMKVTEDKVNDVTAKVTKVAAGLQKQANGTWDKLETVFEARVERALTRLGVPTNKEIAALTKRVEELTRSVGSLTKSRPAKAPAKRARKAA
ncbi:MAG TPA: phasin family protein [Burkholderiaceae bacterium]|nr:phasin family protein [Burkholderiaceae bacterium]